MQSKGNGKEFYIKNKIYNKYITKTMTITVNYVVNTTRLIAKQ